MCAGHSAQRQTFAARPRTLTPLIKCTAQTNQPDEAIPPALCEHNNLCWFVVYRHHPGFCSCGDTYTEPDECSHCPGEACRILDHRHANHWYYTRYECETSNTVWKRNTKVCFLGLPLTPIHTHTLSSPTHIETARVFVLKA